MISRLLRSLLLWYVYVVHIPLLRLIPPYLAILLARGFTWIRWLLVILKPTDSLNQSMAKIIPAIRPDLSIHSSIYRHLNIKHQHFVEWNIYPTARGRRFVARSYQEIDGLEHLDAAIEKGQGVVLLNFHCGMFRMIFPALQARGYDTYHHLRATVDRGRVFPRVAKIVSERMARSEKDSGLKMIYHRPFVTFAEMARLLNQNEIIGVNGDGMMGTDFYDISFLEGTISLPTGPAMLAAHTDAPILPVYCFTDGLFRHRVKIHPAIYCRDTSPASVHETMTTYVGILDKYVREQPWQWWTWRRLLIENDNEGRYRLTAQAHDGEEGLDFRSKNN